MRKLLLFACSVIVCVSFLSSSAAMNEVTALEHPELKIMINGQTYDLGSPIVYNGTTYLPVYALMELLQYPVVFDQASQTLYIGNAPGGVNVIDFMDPYYNMGMTIRKTADADVTEIAGQNYTNWMKSSDYGSGQVNYNLMGRYSELTFSAYSDYDRTISIYGDNDVLLANITITGNALPKVIALDVRYVTQLKIICPSYVSIFNMFLD